MHMLGNQFEHPLRYTWVVWGRSSVVVKGYSLSALSNFGWNLVTRLIGNGKFLWACPHAQLRESFSVR